MSPKELQALIREKEDFKKWSAQDKSCLDFLIQPEQLPEPEEDPPFFSGLRHGIFSAAVPLLLLQESAATSSFLI